MRAIFSRIECELTAFLIFIMLSLLGPSLYKENSRVVRAYFFYVFVSFFFFFVVESYM